MKKLKKIKLIVEKESDISDLSINTRKTKIVWCRYIYYFLAKKYTKYSLAYIGEIVNRDHSSVLHGLSRIDLMDQYIEFDFKEILTRSEHSVSSIFGNTKKTKTTSKDELIQQIDKLRIMLHVEKVKSKYKLKKFEFLEDKLNEIPVNKVDEFLETRLNPFLKMCNSNKTLH